MRYTFCILFVTMLASFVACNKDDPPQTEQYLFTVLLCNTQWSYENSVAGTIVSGANITIYKADDVHTQVGTFTTGADGKATITLPLGDYTYKVEKDGARNITATGYQVAGIFTSKMEVDNWPEQAGVVGDVKIVDVNQDGIINIDDQIEYVPLQDSQEVYIFFRLIGFRKCR